MGSAGSALILGSLGPGWGHRGVTAGLRADSAPREASPTPELPLLVCEVLASSAFALMACPSLAQGAATVEGCSQHCVIDVVYKFAYKILYLVNL